MTEKNHAPISMIRVSSRGKCVCFLILALALVSLFSGCAFLNPDNTPTLNFVKDHVMPESKTAKVIATPFLYPVGLAAVVADTVIVHPATVIDDAAGDTKDCLWDNFEWDEKYATECAALPWRAVATPVVFSGDFLGRAMFDIPDRAYKTKKGAENRERLGRLRSLIEANDIEGIGKELAAEDWWSTTGLSKEEADEMLFLRYKAMYLTGKLEFEGAYPHEVKTLWETKWKPDVEAILQEMKMSQNPLSRWYAYMAKMRVTEEGPEKISIFREAVKDEDPVLRYRMLDLVLGLRQESRSIFKSDLEDLSRNDPNPTVRATAAKIVKKIQESQTRERATRQ